MNTPKLFGRYGRKIALLDSERETLAEYSGFIQPLRYKNKMYLDGINTEIGFNSQGYYLYIGPPEYDLTDEEQGYCLLSDGVFYQIDRAEKVFAGENVFYIWAIIRKIVEVV